MELLESSRVRPRQARYQAALRPDSTKFLFYWNLQLLSWGFALFDVQWRETRAERVSRRRGGGRRLFDLARKIQKSRDLSDLERHRAERRERIDPEFDYRYSVRILDFGSLSCGPVISPETVFV
jgi:hypothetical protein